MKKILVPTDFSDYSMYASDVAVELAPKLDAEVHFFHKVSKLPGFINISQHASIGFPDAPKKESSFEEKFNYLKDRYKNTHTRISFLYSEGDLLKAMVKHVAEQDVAMVVMGSTGASGLQELIFGSFAQKVVRKVPCPVLVIKHKPENLNFKEVVFASDFRDDVKDSFNRLVDFGQNFGSHLHLLNIEVPEPEDDNVNIDTSVKKRMEQFQTDCFKLPCTTHEFSDIDIELGIRHFAQDNQTELIAAVSYGEKPSTTGGLFKYRVTEALVNHLETPILTINAFSSPEITEEYPEMKIIS